MMDILINTYDTMAKILLVEDEVNIASFIERGLREFGHEVYVAYDGAAGWELTQKNDFQLLILDIIMPKMNGLQLCKQYRQRFGYHAPVIMLTALGTTEDIVSGLDAGADDYLVKPFSFQELEARIKALLRRSGNESVHMALRCGDLVLDPPSHRAIRNGQVIDLTVKEYRLLEYFIQNQGTALSRMNLLKNVWDKDFDTNTNVVDVYVNYLRTKIDKDFEPKPYRGGRGLYDGSMKTGNKIALFYSAITIGVIAVVTLVFYWVSTSYISRLYYSYLTEKAYATAQKHWEKDETDDESYARIQQRYEETLPVATEILLNADSLETRQVLSRYLDATQVRSLYQEDIVHFKHDTQMGAALYYPDNEGNFIVIVLSGNQYGMDIQHRIGWLLLGLILVSSVLIYFVGRLYATRMVDRIDAAYQSEKAFISNASHELNNPLTAIQGECEISLLKERSPEEYQAALRRIATETSRIIQLIKHLLFLSHGDKEIQKSAMETIFLADFLMQFSSARISFSPDNFSYMISANPYLLKIAIKNILSNACKYSDDKSVEMRLRGSVLTISDRGIGIPPEELKRIFQPFYRASNTREYAGHGVGLSLSLRILSTYGAKVNIISDLGVGTSVEIDFG